MNPLFAAAVALQSLADRERWRTTVIGGLAVQRWGEPRQTRDVDVALLTGFGDEERYVDRLLAAYLPRRPDARAFAIERRVLLIQTEDAIPIDVSLAALPFEERVADRSTPFLFEPGASIVTCSAEDLIVLKAFADRVQDWLDVEGIIVRQGAALRREQVLEELSKLLELKEDDAPGGALRRLFQKHPG